MGSCGVFIKLSNGYLLLLQNGFFLQNEVFFLNNYKMGYFKKLQNGYFLQNGPFIIK